MISLSSSSLLLLLLLLIISNQSHLSWAYKYCGIDITDASTKCWQPCSSDIDCCSIGEKCHDADADNCGSNDKSGSQHNYCGLTWCDAAYTCGTPCPNEDECEDGEYCFADTPCDSATAIAPPILPPPPTSSPYMYCGKSFEDAKLNCWQPCPRGDVDCCSGLTCHDTTSSGGGTGTTCEPSIYSGTSHYYCGASWCDAAYTCKTSCPSGQDTDCPTGQYCYADTPCDGTRIVPEIDDSSGSEGEGINNVTATTIVTPPPDESVTSTDAAAAASFLASYTSYCGTSLEHATELCWQPCRTNDDCCANQTCYTNISTCGTSTTADTDVPKWSNNIGADHFFCGKDYCDASYECKAPCSSGYDAECPLGLRCLPNTPCNANMRSYSSSSSSSVRDYGLPTRALDMYQQYQSSSNNIVIDEQHQSQTKARNVIVGLFFGVCIIALLGMNYMLYQRRRMIGGATVAKKKNHNNNNNNNNNITDSSPWLYRDIKVRIISKKLDDGIYYKRQGIIKRIIDKHYADVELLVERDIVDGTKVLLRNIHQNDLETVIPRPTNNDTNTTANRVRIVNGRYRGKEARVIRLNKSEYYAELLLLNNGEVEYSRNSSRTVIVVDYEDFSAIA